jgi:hypothetical protein
VFISSTLAALASSAKVAVDPTGKAFAVCYVRICIPNRLMWRHTELELAHGLQ